MARLLRYHCPNDDCNFYLQSVEVHRDSEDDVLCKACGWMLTADHE